HSEAALYNVRDGELSVVGAARGDIDEQYGQTPGREALEPSAQGRLLCGCGRSHSLLRSGEGGPKRADPVWRCARTAAGISVDREVRASPCRTGSGLITPPLTIKMFSVS